MTQPDAILHAAQTETSQPGAILTRCISEETRLWPSLRLRVSLRTDCGKCDSPPREDQIQQVGNSRRLFSITGQFRVLTGPPMIVRNSRAGPGRYRRCV